MSKVELYKALAKAKAEMGSVKKSSDNPFFKSKYADLNSHLDLVEPLLEKHGLLLLQPTKASDTNIVMLQIIHVATGEMLESSLTIPASITDAQKVGAAITYFRRFLINSTLSLKSEDDDGESVVGRGKNSGKTTTVSAAPTPTVSKSSFSSGTTGTGKAF